MDVYVAAESGLPAPNGGAGAGKAAAQREICVDSPCSPTPAGESQQCVASANQAAAQPVPGGIEANFSGALLGRACSWRRSAPLFAAEGVENCRITVPAADVAAEDGVLPVLGTLSFTALGA